MKKLRQFIVYTLIFTFNWISISAPTQAAIIDTDALVRAANRDATQAKVLSVLSRPALVQQMEKLGVDPATARDRVAALTDDELAALDQRLDSLPAGGDVLGALLFVFVLLLVTDILGLTKVFPFTRAQRR